MFESLYENWIMTKKRKLKLESALAKLESVEQELLGEGKQLSMAFYAMKNRVLKELEAAWDTW